MAGLLIFLLVIEKVYPKLQVEYVTLFSNNSPNVLWAKQRVARGSLVEIQIMRALELRLKKVWGITFDAFAFFWENKCHNRYSVTISWQ